MKPVQWLEAAEAVLAEVKGHPMREAMLRGQWPELAAALDVLGTAPRMGVPPDKMGMFTMPVQQPGEGPGEVRQAVVIIMYPPEGLRDAPRHVIEQVVAARKANILASIVDEIFKSYTSDPADPTTARVLGETLIRHADAQRRG